MTRRNALLSAVALAVGTAVLFLPVMKHQFINFDDDSYVTFNPFIRSGLNWDVVRWAFTKVAAANWHPLTWISHAADISFFGFKPAGHHATSLVLHALNTSLLFLVLFRMTGALSRSVFVAGLFGFHPLHVESVAWIAERKDVLSTFFGLVALAAYLHHVRRPGLARLLLSLVAYSASLLSKPMLVSLPFLLLLLDYWPLCRLPRHRLSSAAISVLVEKVPFFALALAASAAAITTQGSADTIQSLAGYPVWARLGNAVVSYATYLLKTVWPSGLAVYYPHPGNVVPAGKLMAAALVFMVFSGLAIWTYRRRPYLFTGWYWYVISLTPVIGIVQVGQQSMADRYTYVPLIGIFLCASWIVFDWANRGRRKRAVAVSVAFTALVACALVTRVQLGFWSDSVTLFQRAVAVTSDNWLAHGQLGQALAERGQIDQAIVHYEDAMRIDPFNAHAGEYSHGLARMLFLRGRWTEAYEKFLLATRIKPQLVEAHNGLGVVALALGRPRDALRHFADAARWDPMNPVWYFKMGLALEKDGRFDDAKARLRQALQVKPDFPEAFAALERLSKQR